VLGGPAWASGDWRFVVRGAHCRCALVVAPLVVAAMRLNPAALPGSPLYEAFVKAHAEADDKRVTLAFHGTAEANLAPILAGGLDPARRCGQACGPGEYFALQAATSLSYCRGGKAMLVFALLLDKSGVTLESPTVVVVHRAAHQLPLAVMHFA
jgi:hypothetical protein